MSRLIDEKEFINSRPENLNPNMSDEIKSAYNKGWNDCNSEWISLIEEQPTAYDIDKVVEKLKERASQSCAVLFATGIEEAISIIKAGEQDD